MLITQNMLSPHSGINLEIDGIKKSTKYLTMCKLNNSHLNNLWVKEESKREI